MSALEQVATLKRQIEELKLRKARLQERLNSEKAEKERLLQEAEELGVPDPRRLSEWVEEKKTEFEEKKQAILQKIEEAQRS